MLDVVKDGGIATIYAYQPGDGTRYEIELVVYGNHATVAWLNGVHRTNGRDYRAGGSSMRLPEHAPDAGYIAEKMGLRMYDAEVIAQFLVLAYVAGRWSHSQLQSAAYAAPEVK